MINRRAKKPAIMVTSDTKRKSSIYHKWRKSRFLIAQLFTWLHWLTTFELRLIIFIVGRAFLSPFTSTSFCYSLWCGNKRKVSSSLRNTAADVLTPNATWLMWPVCVSSAFIKDELIFSSFHGEIDDVQWEGHQSLWRTSHNTSVLCKLISLLTFVTCFAHVIVSHAAGPFTNIGATQRTFENQEQKYSSHVTCSRMTRN